MNIDLGEYQNNNHLISPLEIKFPKFTPKLNLAVMASGEGSNFEALVHATRGKLLDATISILIVNNPNCNAINKAKKLNVPFTIINHKEYRNREQLDCEIINRLKNLSIDGIIMAGWMRIVTNVLIKAYPDRIINIHPSLLPSFPGINAIEQALKEKVCITGCSVHLVREKVDNGPILIQAAVPVLTSDNKITLSRKIQIQEHRILPIGVSIAGQNWRHMKSYG
ncbi:phosphoribosylglycinamide formyltransferase [Prochlorococcus sp. MIT 1307]|uniref:phosphoribosylglycinamide formyltransferase n=1 Tax=Prochlorococcus sp. MIT 1307 TaxID=3096219 RepID=UPI002A757718|nr:phosphoribosylglycinamide formyltransferase [Prochlorococcus sp. MIT 1307]